MRKLSQTLLRRTYGFVNWYQQKYGESPSYREIMRKLEFSSLSMVCRYIDSLENDGALKNQVMEKLV